SPVFGCSAPFLSAARSADELVDVAGAEAARLVVLAAPRDLGVDVFVAGAVAVRVDVDHRAADVQERDHLVVAGLDDEGVDLARRLVHEGACARTPLVLEVAPRALDAVADDDRRMDV